MFSKTEMRAFSVDLCSSALTSTELNIIIMPGVSQGYTLLAHFCMLGGPLGFHWEITLLSPFLFSLTDQKKRGLSRQRINSFKFTVSAQAFSDELLLFFFFFFCSNADKTLLNVAYLKTGSKDMERCELNF